MSAGDEAAFRELFDQYKHRLFVFVEQLIHSRADAEEIVQDTFLKVWQSASRLAEIEQPGHYIYTIARNKTLNYMRSLSRDQRLLEIVWARQSELDDTLEEQLRTKEVQEIIDNALRQLPAQKQEVFRLSRERGLTHAQIATMLGLSESRIKNILVETLKHIKACLKQHSDLLAILFWMKFAICLF
jgi:RNA polymerase sigma-70 factor (family 1)